MLFCLKSSRIGVIVQFEQLFVRQSLTISAALALLLTMFISVACTCCVIIYISFVYFCLDEFKIGVWEDFSAIRDPTLIQLSSSSCVACKGPEYDTQLCLRME